MCGSIRGELRAFSPGTPERPGKSGTHCLRTVGPAGQGFLNAFIPEAEIDKVSAGWMHRVSLLVHAMKTCHLSMRGFKRVIKVARSIADLEGSAAIRQDHLAEALQYRPELGDAGSRIIDIRALSAEGLEPRQILSLRICALRDRSRGTVRSRIHRCRCV